MTFEILISTMHKNKEQVVEMLANMNIKCNCVVVNQCDTESLEEFESNGQKIKIVSTKERGLSRSRNMAIENATADIVCIADDDLDYYDNFDKSIVEYYENHKEAEFVIFNMDDCYKTFPDKEMLCSFISLSGYKSVQLTFKREIFLQNQLKYNLIFGTGSEHYQSGEENILLADVYRKGIKITYYPTKILKRHETDSSWFKGYTEDYISARGAIYYAISKNLYALYVVRFALKLQKLQKDFGFFKCLKLMKQGRKEYKEILSKESKR